MARSCVIGDITVTLEAPGVVRGTCSNCGRSIRLTIGKPYKFIVTGGHLTEEHQKLFWAAAQKAGLVDPNESIYGYEGSFS